MEPRPKEKTAEKKEEPRFMEKAVEKREEEGFYPLFCLKKDIIISLHSSSSTPAVTVAF